MDAVKSFNQELSSLYEIKPPISKAKMTSITKGAIKAIKFYKHVVQSVEKFIQKCRPEYKIPGLYVIDSIVRQSRHQFGADKDVFAPRFAKNVNITFWHLYKCAEDEKSKVIRVLNLWQKNQVFSSEVIQPLFDLANPLSEMSKTVEDQVKRGNEKKCVSAPGAITLVAPESIISSNPQATTSLNSPQARPWISMSFNIKFNKKVLDDFDYSDEEDGMVENDLNHPPAAMIEALQGQIQQLQQLLPASASRIFRRICNNPPCYLIKYLFLFNNPQSMPAQLMQMPPPPSIHSWATPKAPPPHNPQTQQQIITLELEEGERVETDEDIQIVEDRSNYTSGRRSRSRDRSKRRRSRSRSPGRRKSRRSRSRSRDRSGRRRDRDRDRDEEREKRKEREKKGLPLIKKDHLSVCSTTLWVGHLSRLVAEDHLSDIFGEYGEIVSIDLIPPRGCAFVCMNRRMDAAKALKSLYKYKINNKPIILAWAPGKGMKDKQWKDYWDVDLGVSYIPINKLDPQVNMADLEEGGMFDEDTMPEWMKTMRGVAPIANAQASPAIGTPTISAPPAAPQFIPVPEGIPPVLEPPPGLNFGMPIPPPGALPPPNVLLAPPRFGRPPPPPPRPIPGGFDTSQPPPGLRLSFPPPIPGAPPTAPPPIIPEKINVPSLSNQSNIQAEECDEIWKPNERSPNPAKTDEDIAIRLRSLAGGMENTQDLMHSVRSDPFQHDSFDGTNGGQHNDVHQDGDFGSEPVHKKGRFVGNNDFHGPPDFHHGMRHRGNDRFERGGRGGRQFDNWGSGPPFEGNGRGMPPIFEDMVVEEVEEIIILVIAGSTTKDLKVSLLLIWAAVLCLLGLMKALGMIMKGIGTMPHRGEDEEEGEVLLEELFVGLIGILIVLGGEDLPISESVMTDDIASLEPNAEVESYDNVSLRDDRRKNRKSRWSEKEVNDECPPPLLPNDVINQEEILNTEEQPRLLNQHDDDQTPETSDQLLSRETNENNNKDIVDDISQSSFPVQPNSSNQASLYEDDIIQDNPSEYSQTQNIVNEDNDNAEGGGCDNDTQVSADA
ncbi:RBM16 [Lepeophtheirus salmonis]|uniref:RBM16 n=1 Tax=Lepeophtheirus salmonis TaxID=72036 RepID=A0A7R8D1U7_LEPSM|nr:RBM16 [Lepeophtheirus salmonis]CAF2999404.1 RBM16 [Lepeophtheirus salmonis]